MIRNCAATDGHLVDTDRDAYIVQGDTYRHVWCTDPTGRLHVLGDPPDPPFADLRTRPLAVGDVLYGYCRGVFGASYGAKTVEAIGSDWVVVALVSGRAVFAQIDPADLIEYRTPEPEDVP